MNEICCYGEILWDIFPDKKLIGGAFLSAPFIDTEMHSKMRDQYTKEIETVTSYEHTYLICTNFILLFSAAIIAIRTFLI